MNFAVVNSDSLIKQIRRSIEEIRYPHSIEKAKFKTIHLLKGMLV